MARRNRKTTCGRCPKWVNGVCVVDAKIMVAQHAACELGRRLINSRDTNARARLRKAEAALPHHQTT